LVKEELKNLRESAISFTRQLDTISQTIDKSQKELDELKNKIAERDTLKINEIQQSIAEYDEKMVALSSNMSKIDEKMPQVISKLKGLNELLHKNKITLQGIDEKKTLYQNSKCPTCESDLTTEYHKSVLEELIKKEIKVNENVEKLNESIKSVNDLKQKLATTKTSLNEKKIEFSTVLIGFRKELEKLQEDSKSLETEAITKIIDDATNRKLLIIKKKDTEDKHTNFYKIVEEIFGDNGVKQLAINKIMPALNAEIRNVLVDLRMDYKVTFNRSFDASISHLGHDVAIQQLSTGEKKKVDFAVLIAIIKMMKMKYPSLNISFLDEIFSSIDTDGIHHILKVLSNVTKGHGMNIFVVNHSPLPTEVFDYKISVSKPNNFSALEIEKII
jgi:DNA repair exonuclease SbcCD ATPase subunit